MKHMDQLDNKVYSSFRRSSTQAENIFLYLQYHTKMHVLTMLPSDTRQHLKHAVSCDLSHHHMFSLSVSLLRNLEVMEFQFCYSTCKPTLAAIHLFLRFYRLTNVGRVT